jgi:hypothetical protein
MAACTSHPSSSAMTVAKAMNRELIVVGIGLLAMTIHSSMNRSGWTAPLIPSRCKRTNFLPSDS